MAECGGGGGYNGSASNGGTAGEQGIHGDVLVDRGSSNEPVLVVNESYSIVINGFAPARSAAKLRG